MIPCYCESHRLPAYLPDLIAILSKAEFPTQILVVDDGSPPQEQAFLRSLVQAGRYGSVTMLAPHLRPHNLGKGGAILHGWDQAKSGEWLLFVDADGAISAPEVHRVLQKIFRSGEACRAYFSCRSAQTARPFLRRLTSFLFKLMTKVLVPHPLRDSQCGFKLVPRRIFQEIRSQLQGAGFCFDVELYLALSRSQIPITEVPISWKEKAGSHLNVWINGPQIIRDLLKVRRRYRNNQSAACSFPQQENRLFSSASPGIETEAQTAIPLSTYF